MKKWIPILLALTLALSGCAAQTGQETVQATVQTQPLPTFPDGDPADVTCLGSYTGAVDPSRTVASCADAELTLGVLQVYYQAEIAQYRQDHPDAPIDWQQSLDTQACDIDQSVRSWQQYFLGQALNSWHAAQALIQASLDTPLEFEEAYQPDPKRHGQYMVDIPATRFLYGQFDRYQLNTMHQAYLESLPDTLEALAQAQGLSSAKELAQSCFGSDLDSLTQAARDMNQGYMYLTSLSYRIRPTQEEVEAFYQENPQGNLPEMSDEAQADIHAFLLTPDGSVSSDGTVTATEEQWEECRRQGEELLKAWQGDYPAREADFTDLTHRQSQDTGTALNGGSLYHVSPGQLIAPVDQWCFDPARTAGDVGLVRTDYGCYALYYSGSTPAWYAQAEIQCRRQQLAQRITDARNAYPMEVTYDAITLTEVLNAPAQSALLYPDVAHERYPEIPLYLQQDYPKTDFGGSPIRTHGCGITSMSMLATYMADEELTPPEMCRRFGRYGSNTGTDGMLFNKEPQSMGFFLQEKTYDPKVALEALEQGYTVISVQHAGYWTRAGHYIVLEKMNEDGTVQVRDSNIFNYNNSYRPAQAGHLIDKHTWSSITANGSGFWIFDYKVTNLPACARCGDIAQTNCHLFTQDYLCRKCRTALDRRETYLDLA